MEENEREQEVVQYLVVNEGLAMSLGKIVAQGSHAAVLIALREVFQHQLRPVEPDPTGRGYLYLQGPQGEEPPFARWINSSFKKVVLRGKQAAMEKLEAQGFLAIRDAGHTEVPPNSLTVVALPPMTRAEARPYVKRFQVFEHYEPQRTLAQAAREHARLEERLRQALSPWVQSLLEVGVPGARGVDGWAISRFHPAGEVLEVELDFYWGNADSTSRRYRLPYQELELEEAALREHLRENPPQTIG